MSTSKGEGTDAYKDPLSLTTTKYKRGKKSDIFSIGVLLWEISSGKLPCEGRTRNHEVIIYRQNGFRDPPFPGTPTEYIKLYSECWSQDADERPSCGEIYKQLIFLFKQISPGKMLDLSSKPIGDEGAMTLAKTLVSDLSLLSLNLKYSNIGEAGATALAEALESNSFLTVLNLKINLIRD